MSTSTVREPTTALVALPRVNLLPPEIAESRRFRKVQIGLGAAALASVVTVGVLFLVANGQVGQAQEALDADLATSTQLQSQVAEYAEVPLVNKQLDAGQTQLAQAMGQEIRWSFLLNDLSLAVPNHVWLTTITATTTGVTAGAPAAQAGDYQTAGIGTVTFSGVGYQHNDVASWLDALAKQKGFTQPYFSSSTVAELGNDPNAVMFTSKVTLTEDALSRRYTQKTGN